MRQPWHSRIVGHGEVDPATLVAHPQNWRTHPRAQARALEGVLETVGWVQDVIVSQRTKRIVDGHRRVSLALERGEATVPVVYVDLSEEEERLVLATFDPIGAMAEADAAALQDLRAQIETDNAAVTALLGRPAAEHPAPPVLPGDVDAVPDPRPAAVSRPGDRWQCGRHRVWCGDARVAAGVAALFPDGPADYMWTDPPYGVEYTGKTPAALTITGDTADDLAPLLRDSFAAAGAVLAPGAAIFVAHPAGSQSQAFGAAFLAAGWHWHQTLIWVKDTLVLGHCDFHYPHEPILYGWTPGRPHHWYGGRTPDSVFAVPRPAASREHPTTKPVALITAHLALTSRPGDLGYDPFAGSGSTVIAAEQLGRRCVAVEIEPRYVDVIVRAGRPSPTSPQRSPATAGYSARSRRPVMAGRRTKLTPDVHQQIVAMIRAGAFAGVAAQAGGISQSTFYRWLERGEARAGEPYRSFMEDVRQAQAQARVTAEMDVRRDNPLAWLRYGPGRTRPGEPGWTEAPAAQKGQEPLIVFVPDMGGVNLVDGA